MRKKGIPKVLVRSVMRLYDEAKTRVTVNSELSEEFEVKVGMHQGSVLSPFHFAVVVDIAIECAGEHALSELLYDDDIVLMSETIGGLGNKFLKRKEAFDSKCLKINLGKTKVMVSDSITKDGMSKSNVDPCGVGSLRVTANSAMCLLCGKLSHCCCC